MNIRRRLIAAALASPLVLAGCKVRTINYFPSSNARVRFANLMLGSVGLDVREGDTVVWAGIPFEASTDFVDFENNEKTFTIALSGQGIDVASVPIALAGEQPYTLIAYGTVETPNGVIVPDTTSSPGSGKFQLRIVDVASGLPNLDIYVNSPDVPFDDNVSPNYVNLNAGSATVPLRFDAGAYRIRATISTTKSVVYDSGAHVFPEETSTDYVFYAVGASSLPQAMQLDIDSAGVHAVVPNAIATVKFLNAATQTGAINASVDGTRAIEALAYAAGSGYALSTAGLHQITVEAVATPGAVIVALQATLTSSREASVLVYGLPGAVKTALLLDDNREPAPGLARVRFVNGSSDGAAYDVFVNDTRFVTSLAAGSASTYFNFSAGAYTVTFRDPATGAVVLTMADTTFGEARVLSVCIVGIAGALGSFVTTDR